MCHSSCVCGFPRKCPCCCGPVRSRQLTKRIEGVQAYSLHDWRVVRWQKKVAISVFLLRQPTWFLLTHVIQLPLSFSGRGVASEPRVKPTRPNSHPTRIWANHQWRRSSRDRLFLHGFRNSHTPPPFLCSWCILWYRGGCCASSDGDVTTLSVPLFMKWIVQVRPYVLKCRPGAISQGSASSTVVCCGNGTCWNTGLPAQTPFRFLWNIS